MEKWLVVIYWGALPKTFFLLVKLFLATSLAASVNYGNMARTWVAAGNWTKNGHLSVFNNLIKH
jgi:hypothetical protein